MNAVLESRLGYRREPLGAGSETLIIANEYAKLNDIGHADLCEWVATYGVVVLRGFASDENKFSALVHQASKRVTVDPARKFVSENAQLVDAGVDKVGLHCENGNAPRLPHLIWFHCVKAARQGSRTTFCDGRRVWSILPAWVKQEFISKRIMYRRHLPAPLWKKYVFHEVGGFRNVDDVSFQDLMNLADEVEGQSFELLENERVFSEFRCNAVHGTRFSSELAFANSMLGPSYNYEAPHIVFEDGSVISEEIWNEIRLCTDMCTEDIPWKDGDIAIIDNTRYMHGRRKILDVERKICAALSYV